MKSEFEVYMETGILGGYIRVPSAIPPGEYMVRRSS